MEQKLDRILDLLYAKRFTQADTGALDINKLCAELAFNGKNLEYEELFELFAALHNEGFILLKTEEKENIDKVKFAKISLQGAFFIQDGGYAKKLENREKEKTKEFWKGVVTVLGGICAGFILAVILRPSIPEPKAETIVLPKIQVVHDTVVKTIVKEIEKPKKKTSKKKKEEDQ